MGFLQDILPILKKHQLVYQSKRREEGDIVTFIFTPEEKLNWKAGQHGIFFINHVKVKKASRAFSIASCSAEGTITISMRITDNPSEYKRALMEMTPGTRVTMRGPIGPFYIKENKSVLMIAGGIGITPYRALLKDLTHNPGKIGPTIELLYVDNKREYIYKDELDEISQHPNIHIKYLQNRDELMGEVKGFVGRYNNNANYYISGSPSMINGVKGALKEEGIKKKNIISDAFIGYN